MRLERPPARTHPAMMGNRAVQDAVPFAMLALSRFFMMPKQG